MTKASVLVVEDDQATARLVVEALEAEGYSVRAAETAFKARGLLERALPALIVLDRRLPDADGVDLCKEIRENPALAAVPVLFLTGKASVADRVVGLKMGGDDYLTKPFSPEELLARVEALLRRSGAAEAPAALEADGLRLDLSARRAFLQKKELPLSQKEFDLVSVLVARKNRVLTRQFLLQHVWGYDEGIELSTKVVDVTLSHLRDKLGAWGRKIAAVRGYGYRLDAGG